MADVGQVLATGVGVTLGAGLTYLFGALNRRHQEAREDKTRWYEARLKAYLDYYNVVWEAFFRYDEKRPSREEASRFIQRLIYAEGTILFVGSPEVIEAAERLFYLTVSALGDEHSDHVNELDVFQTVARKDLGHPVPPGGKHAARKPSAKRD
jgi:hypothetical protein